MIQSPFQRVETIDLSGCRTEPTVFARDKAIVTQEFTALFSAENARIDGLVAGLEQDILRSTPESPSIIDKYSADLTEKQGCLLSFLRPPTERPSTDCDMLPTNVRYFNVLTEDERRLLPAEPAITKLQEIVSDLGIARFGRPNYLERFFLNEKQALEELMAELVHRPINVENIKLKQELLKTAILVLHNYLTNYQLLENSLCVEKVRKKITELLQINLDLEKIINRNATPLQSHIADCRTKQTAMVTHFAQLSTNLNRLTWEEEHICNPQYLGERRESLYHHRNVMIRELGEHFLGIYSIFTNYPKYNLIQPTSMNPVGGSTTIQLTAVIGGFTECLQNLDKKTSKDKRQYRGSLQKRLDQITELRTLQDADTEAEALTALETRCNGYSAFFDDHDPEMLNEHLTQEVDPEIEAVRKRLEAAPINGFRLARAQNKNLTKERKRALYGDRSAEANVQDFSIKALEMGADRVKEVIISQCRQIIDKFQSLTYGNDLYGNDLRSKRLKEIFANILRYPKFKGPNELSQDTMQVDGLLCLIVEFMHLALLPQAGSREIVQTFLRQFIPPNTDHIQELKTSCLKLDDIQARIAFAAKRGVDEASDRFDEPLSEVENIRLVRDDLGLTTREEILDYISLKLGRGIDAVPEIVSIRESAATIHGSFLQYLKDLTKGLTEASLRLYLGQTGLTVLFDDLNYILKASSNIPRFFTEDEQGVQRQIFFDFLSHVNSFIEKALAITDPAARFHARNLLMVLSPNMPSASAEPALVVLAKAMSGMLKSDNSIFGIQGKTRERTNRQAILAGYKTQKRSLEEHLKLCKDAEQEFLVKCVFLQGQLKLALEKSGGYQTDNISKLVASIPMMPITNIFQATLFLKSVRELVSRYKSDPKLYGLSFLLTHPALMQLYKDISNFIERNTSPSNPAIAVFAAKQPENICSSLNGVKTEIDSWEAIRSKSLQTGRSFVEKCKELQTAVLNVVFIDPAHTQLKPQFAGVSVLLNSINTADLQNPQVATGFLLGLTELFCIYNCEAEIKKQIGGIQCAASLLMNEGLGTLYAGMMGIISNNIDDILFGLRIDLSSANFSLLANVKSALHCDTPISQSRTFRECLDLISEKMLDWQKLRQKTLDVSYTLDKYRNDLKAFFAKRRDGFLLAYRPSDSDKTFMAWILDRISDVTNPLFLTACVVRFLNEFLAATTNPLVLTGMLPLIKILKNWIHEVGYIFWQQADESNRTRVVEVLRPCFAEQVPVVSLSADINSRGVVAGIYQELDLYGNSNDCAARSDAIRHMLSEPNDLLADVYYKCRTIQREIQTEITNINRDNKVLGKSLTEEFGQLLSTEFGNINDLNGVWKFLFLLNKFKMYLNDTGSIQLPALTRSNLSMAVLTNLFLLNQKIEALVMVGVVNPNDFAPEYVKHDGIRLKIGEFLEICFTGAVLGFKDMIKNYGPSIGRIQIEEIPNSDREVMLKRAGICKSGNSLWAKRMGIVPSSSSPSPSIPALIPSSSLPILPISSVQPSSSSSTLPAGTLPPPVKPMASNPLVLAAKPVAKPVGLSSSTSAAITTTPSSSFAANRAIIAAAQMGGRKPMAAAKPHVTPAPSLPRPTR